jgi:hypothetical protein
MHRSLRWYKSCYGVDDSLLSDEVRAGRLRGERIGRAIAVEEADFREWAREWLERLRERLEVVPQ